MGETDGSWGLVEAGEQAVGRELVRGSVASGVCSCVWLQMGHRLTGSPVSVRP